MKADVCPILDCLSQPVQFCIPLWQRRFSWDKHDLERLVSDIEGVAEAHADAGHLLGTILTIPDTPPIQNGVSRFLLVDGQQRLTAISILLMCIAEALGDDEWLTWTSDKIHQDLLKNWGADGVPTSNKLRLQAGDDKVYASCLVNEQPPPPAGRLASFWSMAAREVEARTPQKMLAGLARVRVVHATLDDHDNAQQIFESLNTTGRPLSESEKIKNWMLMQLPSDAEQTAAYEQYWLPTEANLCAAHEPERLDLFFQDSLSLQTGDRTPKSKVYRVFSSLHMGLDPNEVQDLFKRTMHLSQLYGMVVDTGTQHPEDTIESELRILRRMPINTHAPFVLRLLKDLSGNPDHEHVEDFAYALRVVGTWVVRIWCADIPTSGLSNECSHMAGLAGPDSVSPGRYGRDMLTIYGTEQLECLQTLRCVKAFTPAKHWEARHRRPLVPYYRL